MNNDSCTHPLRKSLYVTLLGFFGGGFVGGGDFVFFIVILCGIEFSHLALNYQERGARFASFVCYYLQFVVADFVIVVACFADPGIGLYG